MTTSCVNTLYPAEVKFEVWGMLHVRNSGSRNLHPVLNPILVQNVHLVRHEELPLRVDDPRVVLAPDSHAADAAGRGVRPEVMLPLVLGAPQHHPCFSAVSIPKTLKL